MTVVYDELTWQKKTIKLVSEYAENIGVDFKIIDGSSPYIKQIRCPFNYGISYKIGAVKEVSENFNDYDRIFFVDCDIIIDPSYKNVFDIDQSVFILTGGSTSKTSAYNMIDSHSWLIKYIGCTENIFGPINNMTFCSTSNFITTPKICSQVVDFLETNNIYPNQKNLNRLEKYLTVDGKPNWFGDQWMWSMFLTFYYKGVRSEPRWSRTFYPEMSEFLTDLWLSMNRREIEKITEIGYNIIMERQNG